MPERYPLTAIRCFSECRTPLFCTLYPAPCTCTPVSPPAASRFPPHVPAKNSPAVMRRFPSGCTSTSSSHEPSPHAGTAFPALPALRPLPRPRAPHLGGQHPMHRQLLSPQHCPRPRPWLKSSPPVVKRHRGRAKSMRPSSRVRIGASVASPHPVFAARSYRIQLAQRLHHQVRPIAASSGNTSVAVMLGAIAISRCSRMSPVSSPHRDAWSSRLSRLRHWRWPTAPAPPRDTSAQRRM